MYCSQCGKRVTDTMLFCPFCGSPIVIPDQDVPQEVPNTPVSETEPVPRRPRHIKAEAAEEPKAAPAAVEEVPETIPDAEEEAPSEEENAVPELFSDAEMALENGEISEDLPDESFAEESLIGEPSEIEDIPAEEFVPLDLNETLSEQSSRPIKEVTREISDILSTQLKDEPVRLQGHAPDLSNVHSPESPKNASSNTFAPRKEVDDDVFLDGGFDEYDGSDFDDDYDAHDEYDDPDEGSFFMTHIRGLVALGLFIIMAAIVLGWTFSSSGQRTLARGGMAWRPEVYNDLAYEAYQSGDYTLAAHYYMQALSRDEDSYDYANSAAVSYYTAQDNDHAEEMARRAIAIDPSKPEAYQLLLRLYPDPAARPWDIQHLFTEGYKLTGDPSLAS